MSERIQQFKDCPYKIGDKLARNFDGDPYDVVVDILPYRGKFTQYFCAVLKVRTRRTESGFQELPVSDCKWEREHAMGRIEDFWKLRGDTAADWETPKRRKS